MAVSKALIITALDVEINAVREHLEDINSYRSPDKGISYDTGRFQGENAEWTVFVRVVGQGNSSAAVETERAIADIEPEIVFFVGVAGGMKDVKIGDVVVGTNVYQYTTGKYEKGQFTHRPDTKQSSYELTDLAVYEATHQTWKEGIKTLPPTTSYDSDPKVWPGLIGVGEAVVADKKAEIRQHLISANVLAVEKEGYGFLQGIYANRDVNGIVIRGISDAADAKKAKGDKEGFQIIAAKHAAAFAFHLLSKWFVKKN